MNKHRIPACAVFLAVLFAALIPVYAKLSTKEFKKLKKRYASALALKDYAAAAIALDGLAKDDSERAVKFLLIKVALAPDAPDEVFAASKKALATIAEEKAVALMLKYSVNKDFRIRVFFAEVFGMMDSRATADMLIVRLSDGDDRVVREAVKALKRRLYVDACGPLIDLLAKLEKEGGTVWAEVRIALIAITRGEDYPNAKEWKYFWNNCGKDVVLENIEELKKKKEKKQKKEPEKKKEDPEKKPPPEKKDEKKKDEPENDNPLAGEHYKKKDNKKKEKGDDGPDLTTSGMGRNTPKFFDTAIYSKRIIFVMDVSGSMKNKDHYPDEDRKISEGLPEKITRKDLPVERMRLERMKKQLAKCVSALDRGTLFNIISFNDQVKSWKKEMVFADRSNKTKALAFIKAMKHKAQTHTDDALQRAFEEPKVDTIILLSDGAPFKINMKLSSQERKNQKISPKFIEDILAWVSKANRFRKIKIYTFGFDAVANLKGGEICVDFLKQLAKDNEGTYTNIK